MPQDKRFTQRVVTIAAGSKQSFDIGFKPDTWTIFPKSPIQAGDRVYIAVDKQYRLTGLPLSGTCQITLPGLGGERIYIHNTGGLSVSLYIVASKGHLPLIIQTPVTLA